MALTLGMLKASCRGNSSCTLRFLRWAHAAAMPPPLDGAISNAVAPPQMVLPESNPSSNTHFEFGFPGFFSGGSMELMAVPKRKVSPHKRGIRNGPKALKPIPVIIRCRSCGRVKLPHFFCCSGERGNNGGQNN